MARALDSKSNNSSRLVASLFTLILVALASCSPAGEERNESAVPSTFYSSALAVCGLVEKMEAEVVLGYPFEEGEGGFNPDWQTWTGLNACFYDNKAVEGGNLYTGVVYAYADDIFDEVDRSRRPEGKDTDRGVRVDGLGEKALWDPGLGQLMVVTKGKIVGVDIREQELEPRSNRLIRARRLVEKALSRLK